MSINPGTRASLRYLDADFEMIEAGDHVVCAETAEIIPLEDLRYWSVDHQEAYVDAEAAVRRWRHYHSVDS